MRVFGLNIKSQKVSDMNHVKKLNCWGAELSDISIIRLQFQKYNMKDTLGKGRYSQFWNLVMGILPPS